MSNDYKVDEWKIIEKGFDADRQRASESVFSIGNGHMGQRANFEETYSGDSLQGSYIAGVYYPDKTKVGWWKNGYPEYFAKVINSVNWIGINIQVNGEELDLAKCTVTDFERELNMKEGYLKRSFTVCLNSGNKVSVESRRFISMQNHEVGAIAYSVKAHNFSGTICITPYINGDVQNEDSNYDERFWKEVDQGTLPAGGFVTTKTKKTNFEVCSGMCCRVFKNGKEQDISSEAKVASMYIGRTFNVDVAAGDEISLQKYAVVATSFNHERKRLHDYTVRTLGDISKHDFNQLLGEQKKAWADIWETCDIKIEGDPEAQQGIRFNIFQLYQTYTGDDDRLNIGPKGFTGEKYGGVTYWDTEGYCLPFYLCTAGQDVAKNLLRYRYRHLPKAIENAEKLGFDNGAALYPMVTVNGEECHNEWEITFEEIHRNGAIAYAIYNYIRHTGDTAYLAEAGLEVLIAISRFWKQRFQFSEHKNQYVMLGVTGPNEYENNVHNNWYTSYIACWTLRYTMQALQNVKEGDPQRWEAIQDKVNFKFAETEEWHHILDNVYLPEDGERDVFIQQDGFLDKDLRPAASIPQKERPINQHWSWDRILRSCFIKQGDVVQGLYFFEHEFEQETIRSNYDFYEPMTVHESSLSPCIHSVLASSLGYTDRAYELYVRTARLDLDDYNKEVHQGLHITSMAGTWMTIVEGFAGKRIKDGELHFAPSLPENWDAYEFKIRYRGRLLRMRVEDEQIRIYCEQGNRLKLYVFGKSFELDSENPVDMSAQMVSR